MIGIENISKRFGKVQALRPLSLTVPSGELVGLLGPSGSGKTTLLRIIAGLETADEGRLLFHGQDVTRQHVRDRRIGFVFQNYALFRHMTVAENVAFGLESLPRRERPDKRGVKERVAELLEMVRLGSLAARYPSQLSGGQQQRVALARALATEPRVLLLDEPFGALDTKVRKELRRWLRSLHDELGFTSVFVTHDQEEALELSDRVVVMNHGAIEQVATPQALYAEPASRFVFDFLGQGNVFTGNAEGGVLRQEEAWLRLPEPLVGEVELLFWPHELTLQPAPAPHAHLPLVVSAVAPVGANVRLELTPKGWRSKAVWEVSLSHEAFEAGELRRGQVRYAVPRAAHLAHGDGEFRRLAFKTARPEKAGA